MATISVTVHSRFLSLAGSGASLVGRAIAKAARDIEAQAKARAPVDTGLLKNSIEASQERPYAWRVDSPVEYSVYQEFGTSKMPAHPYMVPAADSVRPSLMAALERIVG